MRFYPKSEGKGKVVEEWQWAKRLRHHISTQNLETHAFTQKLYHFGAWEESGGPSPSRLEQHTSERGTRFYPKSEGKGKVVEERQWAKRLRYHISTQNLETLGICVPCYIYMTFSPFITDARHNYSHFISIKRIQKCSSKCTWKQLSKEKACWVFKILFTGSHILISQLDSWNELVAWIRLVKCSNREQKSFHEQVFFLWSLYG